MLLTPQHFQSQTKYLEDLLQFRLGSSMFANWGLTEFECNREGLTNGSFGVFRLQGVLPDGTIIDCPGTDREPAARTFTHLFRQGAKSVDVFIGVPALVDGKNIRTPKDSDDSSETVEAELRYTARTAKVADEVGLDKPAEMRFAQRNLSILFGEAETRSYERLHIAQIVKNSSDKYVLNEEFIPPLLDIATNSTLQEIAGSLIESLGSKIRILTERQSHRGSVSQTELKEFALLQTMNGFLPELQHVWKVRKGHPETLYLTLLRLAGTLCTFSTKYESQALPRYDHDNLGECFVMLRTVIKDLLDMELPSNYVRVELRETDRIWSGSVGDSALLNSATFYLALASDVDGDEMLRRKADVKIAEPKRILTIRNFALPGVSLEPTPFPKYIPFDEKSKYFVLTPRPAELWNEITNSGNISIYIPEHFKNARPELYAVKATART